MWSVSRLAFTTSFSALCAVRQATDMAEDGMTTGSYGAEYARKIRHISHGSVDDEVVPSNA